jgi:hypothetical protein
MTSSHFRACLAAAMASILCQSAPISAQTTEGPHPTFAVASIRPTEGQPPNSGFRRATAGGLNATNVTVKMLIEYAYGVREDQISGGPGWLDTDHYEVVAKPPDDASANDPGVTRLRTQALLADRFHLSDAWSDRYPIQNKPGRRQRRNATSPIRKAGSCRMADAKATASKRQLGRLIPTCSGCTADTRLVRQSVRRAGDH